MFCWDKAVFMLIVLLFLHLIELFSHQLKPEINLLSPQHRPQNNSMSWDGHQNYIMRSPYSPLNCTHRRNYDSFETSNRRRQSHRNTVDQLGPMPRWRTSVKMTSPALPAAINILSHIAIFLSNFINLGDNLSSLPSLKTPRYFPPCIKHMAILLRYFIDTQIEEGFHANFDQIQKIIKCKSESPTWRTKWLDLGSQIVINSIPTGIRLIRWRKPDPGIDTNASTKITFICAIEIPAANSELSKPSLRLQGLLFRLVSIETNGFNPFSAGGRFLLITAWIYDADGFRTHEVKRGSLGFPKSMALSSFLI
ncbi:hypothetical protein CCUS01_05723 [Colletotrichum cuscutae]|uniref:Uncharacterized protein n=1 Tax=Colletotrichum cuscutae TaxID=1209917 RepID=A0AAI9V8P4_9PEZI|nr:hypothetical protein CCUS01_05723 [Colletotrichum cuscutae]